MDDTKEPLLPKYQEHAGPDSSDPEGDYVNMEAERRMRRKLRRRKFFHHFVGFAVVLFVLHSFFGKRTTGDLHGCSGKNNLLDVLDDTRALTTVDDSSESFPWPAGLTIDHCAEWPEAAPKLPLGGHIADHGHGHHDHDHHKENTTVSSFSLPISSDLLFLFAKGPFSTGNVRISQSSEVGDQALVNVTTKYPGHGHILDFVQVCKVKRQDGENGIGFVSYRPSGRHGHRWHGVRFEVDVVLPAAQSEDEPLRIKDFRTALPVFSQYISDLSQEKIYFDSLSLKSGFSHINVNSLPADKASIYTTVGTIEGSFNSTKDLELVTDSGTIDVSVTLLNDAGTEDWTSVGMQASTGLIKGNISLFTSPSTSAGGRFNISALASTGDVTLKVLEAPVNSTVNFYGKSDVGSVDVRVHHTFEGGFDAQGFVFHTPTIDEGKEKADDPEGRGRQRKIEYQNVGNGRSTGSAWWDDGGNAEGKSRGNITLWSSVGDVYLGLGL